MRLQPMGPTPYTASGQSFKVFCSGCNEAAFSTSVYADLDDKPGTYYCAVCVEGNPRFDREKFLAVCGVA